MHGQHTGPVAELRRRLDIYVGKVRRIEYQNAAGETAVTEVAADSLSAVRGFPSGVQQWEWVEGNCLYIDHLAPSRRPAQELAHCLIFDAQGRLVREESHGRVTAEYQHDGPRLTSSSVYEQVADLKMDWTESTYLPQPPEQGGERREQVSTHYPDGLMTVELREFDAQGREIYNELYDNSDTLPRLSRTTYRDDEYGNWVEMCIRVSQQPSTHQRGTHQRRTEWHDTEQAYIHRRVLTYWE